MFGSEEHLATFLLLLLTARNQTGIQHSTSARDPLPDPDGKQRNAVVSGSAGTGSKTGLVILTGNTSVCTRLDGLNSLVLLGQTVFMN